MITPKLLANVAWPTGFILPRTLVPPVPFDRKRHNSWFNTKWNNNTKSSIIITKLCAKKFGVTLQTTFVKIDQQGNFVDKYVAYDEPTSFCKTQLFKLMTLLVLSFLAGALTIAAPCTFTLLPVIVGGSLARSTGTGKSNWKRPMIISASLGLSVIIFTLILKASTALLGIPTMVWQTVSGFIIIGLGITLLKPGIWEKIASGLYIKSNKFLGSSYQKSGFMGDALTGLALGPVFSSCNPTYAFIIAAVLPISFAEGFIYLLAYAIGLSGVLLVVTYLGQNVLTKLGWLSDPKGTFKRVVGVLFLIVGLGVLTGYDKKLETYIIDKGFYDPISNLEQSLR